MLWNKQNASLLIEAVTSFFQLLLTASKCVFKVKVVAALIDWGKVFHMYFQILLKDLHSCGDFDTAFS